MVYDNRRHYLDNFKRNRYQMDTLFFGKFLVICFSCASVIESAPTEPANDIFSRMDETDQCFADLTLAIYDDLRIG